MSLVKGRKNWKKICFSIKSRTLGRWQEKSKISRGQLFYFCSSWMVAAGADMASEAGIGHRSKLMIIFAQIRKQFSGGDFDPSSRCLSIEGNYFCADLQIDLHLMNLSARSLPTWVTWWWRVARHWRGFAYPRMQKNACGHGKTPARAHEDTNA